MKYRPTVAEIHLDRLKHNYQLLTRELAPGQFHCAMVKANGYGHGDVMLCRALESLGCPSFGVALVEEGIHLRAHGLKGQILCFATFDFDSLAACVEHKLTPVISQKKDLETYNKVLASRSMSGAFHLEINTGMNRLGFTPQEVPAVADFLGKHPKLQIEGVFTHLSHGEDFGERSGRSFEQVSRFYQAIEPLKSFSPITHIYSSSSFLGMWRDQFSGTESGGHWPEGIRLGVALYGTLPPMNNAPAVGIKPLMRFKTQVAALNAVPKGQTVSYSGRWRAEKDSLIAILPVGYADGYSRFLTNKSEVLIHGERAPSVGTICMDYIMIDVTQIAAKHPLKVGDEAVLFGWQGSSQLLIDELAKKLDTLAYTIIVGISERVPREYLHSWL